MIPERLIIFTYSIDRNDGNDTRHDDPVGDLAHSASQKPYDLVVDSCDTSEESDDQESDDEDYTSDDEVTPNHLGFPDTPQTENHNRMLEPILSHEKRQLIDRVMYDIRHMLPESPTNRSHAGSEGSTGSTGSNEGGGLENSSNTGGQTRASTRKRGLDDNDSPSAGGGNGGDGEPNKRRKIKEPSDRSNHKYACPFFKRDPEKYKNYRSCPGPGWETVHRLK